MHLAMCMIKILSVILPHVSKSHICKRLWPIVSTNFRDFELCLRKRAGDRERKWTISVVPPYLCSVK